MFKSADACLRYSRQALSLRLCSGSCTAASSSRNSSAQQIAKAPVSNNTEVCQGLTAFEPDKVPSTLLNMLPESKMQVTPGDNDKLVEHYATWKEMGKMFGKNIASISISPDSEVYKSS